jgi:hypothetical protein
LADIPARNSQKSGKINALTALNRKEPAISPEIRHNIAAFLSMAAVSADRAFPDSRPFRAAPVTQAASESPFIR